MVCSAQTSGHVIFMYKTFLPGAVSNAVSALKQISGFKNGEAEDNSGNKFVSTKYFVSRYQLAVVTFWAF